jgi:hypothetical protein
MTISEETRHRLYLRLEEVLGPDEATVLMEHLPPAGWADVATKRDLDAVASKIETSLERGLRGMEHELRLLTWRVMLAMLTLMSLAVATARI